MSAKRRDFVKFAGGAAVGVVATPVPWKLLDDTAIWTQNWDSIPKLPRGPAETRSSVCTLCEAGCGVKASLVGGVPVSLAGRLCPTGLAGHQLPWHPFRLRASARVIEAARKRISEAIAAARKPVAILDGRPGRTASRMFRQALASWNGVYITPHAMSAIGVDVDRIDTVVGFGAPLLERGGQLARGKRVVQVDARHSMTASLAAKWYAVKPGAEGQVSLALARKLMEPAAVPRELADLNAEELARDSGLDACDFDELAGFFAQGKAYAAGANAEVLNAVACGALIERRPVPDVTPIDVPARLLADIEPNSLGVLIVDATALDADVSPRMLRSLLANDGLLVVLSAFHSALTEAGVAIPATAPFESWDDVAPASIYAVSAPLMTAAEGCVAPADFITKLAGKGVELSKEIEARAAAIHASRRGSIGKPVAQMEAKEVWEALSTGTPWIDDKVPAKKTASLPAFDRRRWTPQADLPFALAAFRTSEMPLHQAQPPALTKIYQESELRPSGGTVRMHPETAASAGLKDGQLAVLKTRDGECHASVRIDRLVQRGVLEAPISPSRAELAGNAKPSVPHLLDLTRGAIVAARIERA